MYLDFIFDVDQPSVHGVMNCNLYHLINKAFHNRDITEEIGAFLKPVVPFCYECSYRVQKCYCTCKLVNHQWPYQQWHIWAL